MAADGVERYHDQPLRPGIVFALDPQLWVSKQQLHIHVEDTVVVTGDGMENLTGEAPLETDRVEQVMSEPGVYDGCPRILFQ